MISIVVPTYNRAHTLRLVAASYFEQRGVDELVFVDDAGSDDTQAALAELSARFPSKRMRYVRNPTRLGAPASRNIGVSLCRNAYILFCDDDEYLEQGYAETCLRKLLDNRLGAVSGRRIYLLPGETQQSALQRFSKGLRSAKPFRPILCEYVNGAIFEGDAVLPITNANIITHKSLLERHPFDTAYREGSGYREESDYQLNLFVHGYAICMTNDCHSFHLPLSQVRTGGQRTSPWRRAYWSIVYTRYLYRKYYQQYARRLRLKVPRWLALSCFACFAIYRETLRPPLHTLALALIHRGRQPAPLASAPAPAD